MAAMANCLRLLAHLLQFADSRTFWIAANKIARRIATIAKTTSISISVKADRRTRDLEDMRLPRGTIEPGDFVVTVCTIKVFQHFQAASRGWGRLESRRIYRIPGRGWASHQLDKNSAP